MRLLLDAIPKALNSRGEHAYVLDNISDVAPFRVVNIGNSRSDQLKEFITAIEKSTGLEAVRNLMPMQAGDVPATWADTSLLEELTGYKSKTDLITESKNLLSGIESITMFKAIF